MTLTYLLTYLFQVRAVLMSLKTWLIKLDIVLICYPLEVCLCVTRGFGIKDKINIAEVTNLVVEWA